MSGTRTVNVIDAEAIALMKSDDMHPDMRLMLASIVFADGEGVARFRKGQLQHWLARPGRRRAVAWFVQRRIDGLIEQGVLAEGSTPTELRSMIAYGTEAESGEAA